MPNDEANAQQQLAADRVKLERERLEFEQKKLQRLTIAVSAVAVFVSLLQVGVAYLQSQLTQAQTVEKFIPHLQKPETRDAALLTMTEFADQKFVTRLAEKLKATAVLETFQTQGSDQEKAKATDALNALDKKRKSLVAQMFDPDKAKRIESTTELVRQWANDSKVVPEVVQLASKDIKNLNGVINSLVVLREASPETLRANATDLAPFLEAARTNGAQTAALVEEVVKRTPVAK